MKLVYLVDFQKVICTDLHQPDKSHTLNHLEKWYILNVPNLKNGYYKIE